ncbi:hypothetical protein CCR91_16690 [Thiorhodovibrio winogradskyi]|nr:hypothetical protein [Thiorhodovibrio winogradskyi]
MLMAVSVGLILTCIILIILFIIFVHTMPGKIAKKRGSAQVEAIEILSLLGLLIFPLWMAALVWAYLKPFTLPVELVDHGSSGTSEPEPAPDPKPTQESAPQPQLEPELASDSAPQADWSPAPAQAERPANTEMQA